MQIPIDFREPRLATVHAPMPTTQHTATLCSTLQRSHTHARTHTHTYAHSVLGSYDRLRFVRLYQPQNTLQYVE